MMGSLKALQEWCRIQCEDHSDVDIKNMSTSFRDGLAFCAIIHRHRPDLIDFDSLSKENVYENNRLAFEVAEVELGIPALLDPEDMVSMKVPDRLSIITYVSQYYNFFTNKAHGTNLPMKRPSGTGHNEPAQKRPATPLEDKVVEPEPGVEGVEVDVAAKRSTLSSTCAACQKHVHLVQRFLVDGRLYHRNCFRCRECSSTLLPGSYKLGSDAGSLVCTHHFGRPALASQNGRPDLSKWPAGGVQSARLGRPAPPQAAPSGGDQTSPEVGVEDSAPIDHDSVSTTSTYDSIVTEPITDSIASAPIDDSIVTEPITDSIASAPIDDSIASAPINDSPTPPINDSIVTAHIIDSIVTAHVNDSIVAAPIDDPVTSTTPVTTNEADALDKERDGDGEREEPPPNPFGESEEEEEEDEAAEGGKEEEEEKPAAAKQTAVGDLLPPMPVCHPGGPSRPVPAPRRTPEALPPPRPAPRIRPPRPVDAPAVNGERRKPIPAPKPRERSHSPGSLSMPPKPKDPPWLALVQSESKKKPAPPPPPPGGLATPANAGSLSSLKGAGSRPSTPPPPNPFDDDEEEEEEEEEEGEGAGGVEIPPTLAASHPWYGITRPAEAAPAPDTPAPPTGGCSSRSASPGGSAGKKRRAPHAPKPPPSHQVLPASQSSSRSPSPALSVESLSSASDHSSSFHPPSDPEHRERPDHPFTKSVSEPFICGSPGDSALAPPPLPPSSSSSSAERLPGPHHSPPATPPNTSSAPATPQANRSSARGARPPPPRPPITASPLASGGAGPPSNNKRTCKENPFNRKASPSPVKSSKSRPPRGPRPARPPAPGHGFPLIKRKVQSDQYIPVEDIHGEMGQLEKQLDELEQRGVELEKKLRDNPNDEEEERLLVDWFTLIHEKHLLVRREAELVYTAKQQNLEERQADVEYELRCLLNKPEKEWTEEDKSREQELMAELVTIIEQRNQIITCMDQDRQREEEEDKFVAAMLKKKDFQKEPDGEQQQQQQQKKKGGKFKPMKVLKRLSHKGEPGKSQSPRKDKS